MLVHFIFHKDYISRIVTVFTFMPNFSVMDTISLYKYRYSFDLDCFLPKYMFLQEMLIRFRKYLLQLASLIILCSSFIDFDLCIDMRRQSKYE